MTAFRTSLALLMLVAAWTCATAQSPKNGSKFGTCAVCHGAAAKELQGSVHGSIDISCVTCHGGDAGVSSKKACVEHPGFLGVPTGTRVADQCGSCHSDVDAMRQYGLVSDELTLFKRSPHGKLLYEKNDPDAPTCTSCHGAHATLRASDATSPTHRANVPRTCAKCHADAEMMARHSLPSDIYEKYARSAHGQGLLQHRQLKLPHCGDCHGSHGSRPAGVKEVVNVCGHCHVATRDYFLESAHHAASERGLMNECTTCHDHHETPAISRGKDTVWDVAACTRCHDPELDDDPAAGIAVRIGEFLSDLRSGIADTSRRLVEARGEGIVTAEEETYLNEARHTLIMAGPVSHTASLDQVEVLTQKGQGVLERVRESVDVKLRRVRDRRYAALGVSGVLAVMVLLLQVRLRRHRIVTRSRGIATEK